MSEPLAAVLARFPHLTANVETAQQPPHAAIAQVWILDDRWVLRARDYDQDTLEAFQRERRLLERTRPLLEPELPRCERAGDGQPCVLHHGALWTVQARLPGAVLCPWQELHRAPESERRRLVSSLRQLHDATRGQLPSPDWTWVTRDVAQRLEGAAELLSPTARARVEMALGSVIDACSGRRAADACFVHGDYHWGNLLVDDSGQVTALLDLDWCRVAHPLEDLAYTAMMLIRDYDAGTPRLDSVDEILAWYGVSEAERPLFAEYFILYTLFDVHLFHQAGSLNGRRRFLRYQIELLETLCRDGLPPPLG